jgi:glycine/D-amino acid oxidase-like deaminating enzyme
MTEIPPRTADIIIIGGGIIGTCTAFFLRELGFTGRVLVLERDMTFQFAATTRSAAGIRQQFTLPLNARMSQFGVAFMRSLPQRWGADGEIGLTENGYLLVADAAGEATLRANYAGIVAEGADVALFDPAALAARFPWLHTADLRCGTLGLSGEGWFDAHLFLAAVRRGAKAAGIEYLQAEAAGIEGTATHATGVRLTTGEVIGCATVVTAAGPHSGALAATWGAILPVVPRKRTVFVVRTPLDGTTMPMLFDPSGVWIRPEGNTFVCGIQPPADRDPHPGTDFEPDHDLFEEFVWPALAHRIPAMEQLRVTSAWAGHYEVNLLDHNGVVGPDTARPNVIYATGFSGHGVMHAPATGRAVAELVVHGAYRALDLSPLGFGRIARNAPILESTVY